jgi:hypothetical protein
MQRVYRLLKEAREQGDIPWEWIVDETRSVERVSTWSNPTAYARSVARSYRRNFWDQQPVRVEVWSEKGTVRGVLQPVLDEYGVGFRVMHGFSGATTLCDVAQDHDGRPLIALYVGDFDPSGMWMSERDLPGRVSKYGGDHVSVKRIAITLADTLDCRRSRPRTSKGHPIRLVHQAVRALVLSSMRWTPTTCVRASRRRSWPRSSRSRGSDATLSTRPSSNRCERPSINGGSHE